MTAEEKAREFLEFVGENDLKLRRNLAKNITYDHDVFEDAFQDVILRVHDYILKNDPEIEDYEGYFFQASRLWYFTMKGKRERKMAREISLSGIEISDKGTSSGMLASPDEVKKLLAEAFSIQEAEIFMDYQGKKALGRTSYKKFGLEFGMPSVRVKDAVLKLKKYLRKRWSAGMTSEQAAEEMERMAIEKIRKRMGDGLYRKEEAEEPGKEACEG